MYLKLGLALFSLALSSQLVVLAASPARKYASDHQEPKIRVLISAKQKKLSITGTDMSKRVGGTGKITSYKGRHSLNFNCLPLKKYSSFKNPLLLANITSSTGLLSVDSGKYRGSLLLVAPPSAKGCDVINEVGIETYIGAVLSKEMSPKWPLEALKAQAVAARSYALYKIKERQGKKTYYDLENSERNQVNGDFFDVTVRTSRAQRETEGEVLSLNSGELTPIFFHSKCGGRTRRPDQVWTNAVEGYTNVECPYCHKHGPKDWKAVLPKGNFYSAVDRALSNFQGDKLDRGVASFKVAPANFSDARMRVYDDDRLVVLKKSRIRSTLGRKYTLSNSFSVLTKGGDIVLEGKGFGHGVGLCQYGALEMANQGHSYKEILKHYFPRFKLERLY